MTKKTHARHKIFIALAGATILNLTPISASAETKTGIITKRATSQQSACSTATTAAHEALKFYQNYALYKIKETKVDRCECGQVETAFKDKWECFVEWGVTYDAKKLGEL